MPAQAQTAGSRIPVGANPRAIAVNPVTNKVYVANADSDSVTVINGNTLATDTINVGDFPAWIGINAETNRIYVSKLLAANTSVISGSTDAVTATLASGGGGWTAVNPIKDTTYVVRYGTADEINVIEGTTYVLTFATRSYEPVGVAVNPVNNWVYSPNKATGDVSVLDLTTPVPYPPLKCPDGVGGFRPQPPEPPAPYSLPCIDIPGTPTAVAVNPVTNKIYALSDGVSNQISVINGTNSTYVSLTPPGGLGAAKTIGVNPVTNMVYAVFASAVVVVDGASNAMTVIPPPAGGTFVALGVNVLTNTIFVPNSNGTMLVIDGQTGSTNTVVITAGANAVAVNPLTNIVWVLDSGGGVTPVTGPAGTATATGINATISPLPGNTSGASGSLTVNASSTISPAPLNSVRKVYYRFGTSGPWTAASGSAPGPWTIPFSGLATGSQTVQVFATNGLEAPSINTDLANIPVTSPIATYTFTVSDTTPSDPPRLGNLSTRMQVLTGNDVMIGGFVIGGSANKTVVVRARGPSLVPFGITNALPNPQLQLIRSSDQSQIGFNDDWQSASNAGDVTASGFAPSNSLESAILVNLPPGAYTAIVSGVGNTTGVGIVEVFEVDAPIVPLTNISTRGQVLTGNDVMIGGFIVQGTGPQTVVVRARGPSLIPFGIANALANPQLQLMRSSDQSMVAFNNDWQDNANAADITASGFAPSNSLEAAVLVTLQPGAYTVIVNGVADGTGVGIVEVFATN